MNTCALCAIFLTSMGLLFIDVDCLQRVTNNVPQLECPKIYWSQLSKSMFIPKEAVRNIKLMNFTVTSNDIITNDYTFPISETDRYSFQTVSGRTYTVLLIGQGVDGAWTPEPCRINFSTPLPAPSCPLEALKIKSREIRIHLALCSFDNSTKSAQVIYKSLPIDVMYLDQVVYLPNLEPGSPVTIYIFAVGENGARSSQFQISTFTKPSEPNCSKLLYSATKKSIEVDTRNLSAVGAIQYKITLDGEAQIKSTEDKYTFNHLLPGKMYNVSVTSIGAENQTSLSECHIHFFTRPKGPICTSGETQYIRNVTSTSIIVDLSPFSGNTVSCVQGKPTQGKEPMCIPLQNNVAIIRSLTPSTLYNFTLYSYINDTEGRQLLSAEHCFVGEHYTLPLVDCLNVYWDQNTKTMFVPKKAVQNIKLLNFTVTSQNNDTNIKTFTFAISESDTYFFNTMSGRNYLVLLAGQGVDGAWTQQPCSINFSTPLPAPECPPEALETKSRNMRIMLELCTFDNWTKSAQVIYNSLPVDVTYRKKVVYLPNLRPGSKININIFAVGHNGIKSLPFHTSAFTRPSDPNCSKLSYSATNESIEVDTGSVLTDGAIQYSITLDGEAQIKSTEDKYIFNLLLPGQMYNVSLTAIGAGNETSLNACQAELFTMPQIDCPNISWNSYTKTIFIPKQAVQNIKLLNFTVTSQDNNTVINMYSFAVLETETYFFNTMSGRIYSILVTGQGLDGTWTPEPCSINFTSRLPSPDCPSDALEVKSRAMHIKLELCTFDNWTKSAQVVYNSLPVDVTYLKKAVYLPNLEPGTEVSVNIFAIGQSGMKSLPFHTSVFTRPDDPNCSKLSYSATDETIEIDTRNLLTSGAVQYTVILGGKSQTKSTEDKYIFNSLLPDKMYNVSVTAIGAGNQTSLSGCNIQLFTNHDRDSTVGVTGRSSDGFKMTWSQPHSTSKIDTLNNTVHIGTRMTLKKQNPSTVVAASVSAVLLVFIITIAIIVYLKRTRKGPFRPQNDTYENAIQMKFLENQASKSLLMSNFTTNLQQMHSENILCKEFKEISTNTQHLHDALYENQQSALGIKSEDPLDFRPQEISAFTNEKFLPGFSSKNEYICSQHPNRATLENFLNILFENNINVVVMILNDFIQEEVFQYWPAKVQDTFKHGRFVIGLENQTSLAQNVFREMIITKDGVKSHCIKHFQFTVSRNDKKDVDSFVNFAKSVRTIGKTTKKTMTRYVHCRDGSGWSGVYIAVDILLQKVRKEGRIEIRNLVVNLKKCHPRIIQSEEQYVFLHDCVKSYIRSDLITVEEDHTYQQLDRVHADTDTYEELP